jgi:acetyl-CoA carboxylase biotin carboxyl carrier protein
MEDAFMEGIDQDDVIRIMRMLEESTFDELHLETGGLTLVVSKSGKKASPAQGLKPDHHESTESRAAVEPIVQAREEKPHIPQTSDLEEKGLIAIKAPMLGTFYTAPKPGAPPFVEVGRQVSADDSVCIIEVMKLFNTVKANVQGRIAKICAENGQMVEYRQTLFLVEELKGAVETGEEENDS